MFFAGQILKTDSGFEFEIVEVLLGQQYKAKSKDLALFICIRGKVITDKAGTFLGSIVSIINIIDVEFKVLEDVKLID